MPEGGRAGGGRALSFGSQPVLILNILLKSQQYWNMGHRVSTPRHDGAQGSRGGATASAAILLAAMASVGATMVSAGRPPSSSCRCCFVSVATTGAPPISRPGLRQQQSSHRSLSSLQRQQPLGTNPRRTGGGGRGSGRMTDLRYATHSTHYEQYCHSGTDEEWNEGRSQTNGSQSSSSSFSSPSSSKAAGPSAVEEDKTGKRSHGLVTEEAVDTTTQLSSVTRTPGNRTHDFVKNCLSTSDSSERKRVRMLRFVDRRLVRLNRKYSPSSSPNDPLDPKDSRRLEYEQRKAAWAAKYTSVSTLRKSFGKNKNRLWGDFDPTATRRLYHTLLPRALLELRVLRDGLLCNDDENKPERGRGGWRGRSNVAIRNVAVRNVTADTVGCSDPNGGGDNPSYLQQELKELAPLAYRARLAAKKYARERSRLPGRIGSMLYDGYRSWRRYGTWTTSGMTWEQVWSKYEDQVRREQRVGAAVAPGDDLGEGLDDPPDDAVVAAESDLDDEELTSMICMRILERSVVTNEAIDRLFLKQLAGDEVEDAAAEAKGYAVAGLSQRRRRRRQRRSRRKRQWRRKLRIQADLAAIKEKFDDDIQELLRYSYLTTREGDERRAKKKGGGAPFWRKLSVGSQAEGEGGAEGVGGGDASPSVETAAAAFARGGDDDRGLRTSGDSNVSKAKPAQTTAGIALGDPLLSQSARRLALHEVFALRILATTKQRIELLESLPQLGDLGGDESNVNHAGSDSED